MKKPALLLAPIAVALALLIVPARAEEPVDLDMVNRIRDEGFNRSEVMETLRVLSDEIGPRLTGSPGLRRANEWTRDKLIEWGAAAHLESHAFGRGWTMDRIEVHMTSPRQTQLYALPVTWHPGTDGVIEGEIIHAPMKAIKDFKQYKGKLKGRIVLVDALSPPVEAAKQARPRHDDEALGKIGDFKIPLERENGKAWADGMKFIHERSTFLAREGARVIVRKSKSRGMRIDSNSYQYQTGMTPDLPAIAMANEHYARLVRLSEHDHRVRLSVDVAVTFHDEDSRSYSTIGEIRGEGETPEIVMAGAHLDSWAAGDGAGDNGAGTAVTMEAIRILTALGVKPKRSIRIGLWSGEEQAYFGSWEHINRHYATIRPTKDKRYKYVGPFDAIDDTASIRKQADYDRFSVYFNLDNGGGRIRGIHAEENAAVRPIFDAWLRPFHDLGATQVSLNQTNSTDHESFQRVGLPGFQFIQDPIGAGKGTGHTQLDLFDYASEKDLKQASVIMASFLYHAAMRDERMPRKPEPKPEPKPVPKPEPKR